MNRRQLLKTLVAMPLITLPERWQPPVIEVGYLPGFAQTSSGLLQINNLIIRFGQPLNLCSIDGAIPASYFSAMFDYNDPGGNIYPPAMILISSPNQTNFHEVSDFGLDKKYVVKKGDDFLGEIWIIGTCIRFNDTEKFDLTLQLRNARGQLSNPMIISVDRPQGAE